MPVSWADASRFRWVMVWGTTLWVAIVSAALYPWADLESFRINCSAWMYASIPGFGGGTAIYPSEYPFFALLTGPGLILVLACVTFAAGSVFELVVTPVVLGLRRIQRERTSAVSCYLMGWWGGCGVLFACDLAYQVFKMKAGDFKPFWIGILLLAHVVVLGGGCVATRACFKGSTRSSALQVTFATIGMLIGAVVVISFCGIVVDYTFGVVAAWLVRVSGDAREISSSRALFGVAVRAQRSAHQLVGLMERGGAGGSGRSSE